MNKKLLASLLLVGLVAGCGETKESSKTSSQASSSVTSSVTTSVTSEESSSEESSSVLPSSSSESSKEESSSSSSTTKDSSSSSSSNQNEESSSIVESSSNNSSIEESSSSSAVDSNSSSSSTEDNSSNIEVDPYASKTMYIKGAHSGWGTTEMTYKGSGVFEITNVEIKTLNSEYGFVDENNDWYGNPAGGNYVFESSGVYTVTFTFIEDGAYEVSATKTADLEVTYPTEWYLIGSNTGNGWEVLDDYKLKAVENKENTYSITVDLKENAIFKIATSDWSVQFNYSHLTESSREYFEVNGTDNNIMSKGTGNFTFTIDCEANTLEAKANGDVVLPEGPTIENAYYIEFTLPTWSPAAQNPRLYYWGSSSNSISWEANGSSNMTLKEGTENTYYFLIDSSVTLEGIIVAFEQGSDFKQSIDIKENLPTTVGSYVINVDWSANWQQNSNGTWCFVASISTLASTTNLGVLPDEGYGPLH